MFYIGIDIGGMTIKGGIIDEAGKMIVKSHFDTLTEDTAEIIIKKLADFILELCNKVNINIKEISGIGLGIPGTVENEIVRFSNNLHWSMVPVVDLLSGFLSYDKKKIFAENDANVAILGEIYCGSCKDLKHAVIITLGTGVGTGIVNDGKMVVGNGACGAEGGHMVLNPNGPLCTCGRKGCFESFASATALIRMTKEAIDKHPDSLLKKVADEEGKVSGKTAFVAYKQGDKVARRIVKAYLKYIAIGITNLGNILRPQVVVIGGGVSNEGEWFINAIQAMVDKEIYGGVKINPRVIIKKATLGNDAGIIGAASLAMYNLSK